MAAALKVSVDVALVVHPSIGDALPAPSISFAPSGQRGEAVEAFGGAWRTEDDQHGLIPLFLREFGDPATDAVIRA